MFQIEHSGLAGNISELPAQDPRPIASYPAQISGAGLPSCSGPSQCAQYSAAKFHASSSAGTWSVGIGSSVACFRDDETCHRSGHGVAQIVTTTPAVLSAWWM